jgi:hypothetical protein
LQAAHALVNAGEAPVLPHQVTHIGIVGALAAWRVSQGIYRFDPDLAAAVAETPPEGELPTELLYRLPEWCVYVETPGRTFQGHALHGFWAHLDWELGEGADELRLLLDVARTSAEALDAQHGLIPIPVILGEGSLADAPGTLAHLPRRRGPQRAQAAPDATDCGQCRGPERFAGNGSAGRVSVRPASVMEG